MTAKLIVFAKPNARKSRVLKLREDGSLEVAIAAPPSEGRANEELIRVIADALGVAKKDVAIASGATGKNKRLAIESISDDELRLAITRALAE